MKIFAILTQPCRNFHHIFLGIFIDHTTTIEILLHPTCSVTTKDIQAPLPLEISLSLLGGEKNRRYNYSSIKMGRKSRHYRDESDPLLGFYHQTLAATSSIRNTRNPLYASSSPPPTFSSPPNRKAAEQQQDGDDNERIATASSMPLFSLSKASSSSSTSSFDNDYIQDGIITKNKPAYSNNKAPEKKKNVSFLGYHYRTNNDTVDTINEANIHEKDEDTNKQSTRHNDSKKKKKEEKKKNGYRVHRVSYTAQDHIQVMFRLYGSAFPSVFPFVLVNVGWTFIVYWLKHHTSWADWTFHSSIGHSFMGLLVSFLIVSRSQISYTRFMDYRKLLAKTYQSCREIVQYTTVYTMYTRTIEAKQWREQVCYQTILLLRVTMDALLWSSTERYQWEDEYYRYSIDRDCKSTRRGVTLNHSPSSFDGEGEAMNSSDNTVNNYVFNGEDDDVSEHFFRFRNLTHGRRSNIDEHFRAPITSMHVLRTVIMEHPQYLGYKLAVNEYRDLLTFVSNFDKAFHGFRVLVFTPYPFPVGF